MLCSSCSRMNVCLPYCFLQTSLAADESSSVIVTTSNKEKYRCLLPKEIDEQEKQKVATMVVSVFVICIETECANLCQKGGNLELCTFCFHLWILIALLDLFYYGLFVCLCRRSEVQVQSLSSFIAGNRKNICYIVWLTFQLANQIGTNLPLTDDVICSCQNLLYFIFAA